MTTPPRERLTVRVLMIDEQDRILLMKGRLPSAPDAAGAWFPIGGGMEAGESVAEAAAREIAEETGIADYELGPVVWLRQGVLDFETGAPRLFKESYVVARCLGAEPSREDWAAHEHALIDDIRWWRREDLLAVTDQVFPPGLAERLEGIVAGRLPLEPVTIPWA